MLGQARVCSQGSGSSSRAPAVCQAFPRPAGHLTGTEPLGKAGTGREGGLEERGGPAEQGQSGRSLSRVTRAHVLSCGGLGPSSLRAGQGSCPTDTGPRSRPSSSRLLTNSTSLSPPRNQPGRWTPVCRAACGSGLVPACPVLTTLWRWVPTPGHPLVLGDSGPLVTPLGHQRPHCLRATDGRTPLCGSV